MLPFYQQLSQSTKRLPGARFKRGALESRVSKRRLLFREKRCAILIVTWNMNIHRSTVYPLPLSSFAPDGYKTYKLCSILILQYAGHLCINSLFFLCPLYIVVSCIIIILSCLSECLLACFMRKILFVKARLLQLASKPLRSRPPACSSGWLKKIVRVPCIHNTWDIHSMAAPRQRIQHGRRGIALLTSPPGGWRTNYSTWFSRRRLEGFKP